MPELAAGCCSPEQAALVQLLQHQSQSLLWSCSSQLEGTTGLFKLQVVAVAFDMLLDTV
jgi:uncharacterized membrane protein YdcZ (DUF606 family)